ncbi:MAG: DUF3107 family protein [Acidimicrobiia bacterium]
MKVRIGVAETNKVVELDIDDEEAFKKEIESRVAAGGMAWFTDTKGHAVGLPSHAVAYVEIESEQDGRSVGFAPAV